MSLELIYTSAPRGLRPGTSGFCTVAMTGRIPDPLVERLESLSGYRAVYPLGDPQAAQNPVVWAHWRINVGDRPRSVLSRVAFAGADYSQRSNKFAHHIVVEPNEQPPAGPAWVLGQRGVMESEWAQEPCLLPAGRPIPRGDRPAASCSAWEAATGDAGWAGVLADAFRANPSKPSYIIFHPGIELLPLMEEAIALLPASMRWQVTFSTYFTDLPMGATCAWRCVIAGTPAAKEAMRAGTRPIDLTKPLGAAPEGPMTEAARTGRPEATATASALPVLPRTDVILGFKPDADEPETGESWTIGQSTDAAPARRRLKPPVGGFTVEDEEAEPYLVTDGDRIPQLPPPRPAYRRSGISAWLASLFCMICLAGGVGGGYQFAIQMKQFRAQRQSDEVLGAQLKADKLSSELDAAKIGATNTGLELQKANQTITALRNQQQQQSEKNRALTDALETQKNSFKKDLETLNAQLATVSKQKAAERSAKLPEAPTDFMKTDSVEVQDWLPSLIRTSLTPKNDIELNDVKIPIKAIKVAFPNGTGNFPLRVGGGGLSEGPIDGGKLRVNLVRRAGDKPVLLITFTWPKTGSIHFETSLATFNDGDEGTRLKAEVDQILQFSTLLICDEKGWRRINHSIQSDRTPEGYIGAPDTTRSRLPSSSRTPVAAFPMRLEECLVLKIAPKSLGEGWDMTAMPSGDAYQCIKNKNGLLTFSINCSPFPNSNGEQVAVGSNWAGIRGGLQSSQNDATNKANAARMAFENLKAKEPKTSDEKKKRLGDLSDAKQNVDKAELEEKTASDLLISFQAIANCKADVSFKNGLHLNSLPVTFGG